MVTCAILAALSVVALAMGTLLQIADLSASAMAGMIILLVILCYGSRYAALTFAVTSVLSLILMPQSLATWTYILLFGYYPIVHMALRRRHRVLGWVIKIFLLGVLVVGCLFVFHYLIFAGEGTLYDTFVLLFGMGSGAPALLVGAVMLELLVYVLYDFLLGRLILLYPLRLARIVERWMKP